MNEVAALLVSITPSCVTQTEVGHFLTGHLFLALDLPAVATVTELLNSEKGTRGDLVFCCLYWEYSVVLSCILWKGHQISDMEGL